MIDNWTWCIQKSKDYPKIVQVFMLVSRDCWLITIFMYGIGSSLIIYIWIQFDERFSCRNYRDIHYILLIVLLPSYIGSPSTFKPIHGPLRLYYGMILITGVLMVTAQMAHFYKFAHRAVPRYQIKTIDEIVDGNFRLAGTRQMQNLIKNDSKV